MRPSKQRQEGANDAELPDDVHVELPRELLLGQELERRRDRDSCVRDKRVERFDRREGLPGRFAVRDIEHELARSFRRIARVANRREHLPPEPGEAARARLADPGRRAGYERSRYEAISARSSRPNPSAPSSSSARL